MLGGLFSNKSTAAVFVDYEHWYYGYKNIFAMRPNVEEWYKELKEEYNVKSITFFGDFHGSPIERDLERLEKLGFSHMPICMAKTQYSLTDDQTKLGRPTGFRITVRQVTISAGAGFVVALTGEIMKMPGLPKVPAAEKIDVDEDGKIYGLF